MIKQVDVITAFGNTLSIILDKPELSGLIITSIDGLGPGKSTISASSGSFASSYDEPRNIVLKLNFMEHPTIEAVRIKTYSFFQNGSKIRLDITTDAGIFYIYGYVESNEPNIFSENSGCTISVICPDPLFRSTAAVDSGYFERTSKLFSFPFSNDSTLENPKSLIMGEKLPSDATFIIDFEGTVNVGPIFTIQALAGVVDNPEIWFYNPYSVTGLDVFRCRFTTDLPRLEPGDSLIISCLKNNKYVLRYDSERRIYKNYIGSVAPESKWPMLYPGVNEFSYRASSDIEQMRLVYEYEVLFYGI